MIKEKNYILNKSQLKQILENYMSFVHRRVLELQSQGKTPMKSDRYQMIEDFLADTINELSVDNLLDEVDEVLKKTIGKTSKDFIDEMLDKRAQN